MKLKLRAYIGGGTKKFIATTVNHLRPSGSYRPLAITQLIGGKTWSIAFIRLGPTATNDTAE